MQIKQKNFLKKLSQSFGFSFLIWLTAICSIWIQPVSVVHAADPVICSATMGGGVFDFGSYNPLSATPNNTSNSIAISCQNMTHYNYYVSVCFNIGDGPNVQNGYRQMLGPNNTALNYQLYQDAAHTQVWGSVNSTNFPNPVYLQFYLRRHQTYSQNIPIYGQLAAGQTTALPGNYLEAWSEPTLRITGLLGYYYYPGFSGCQDLGSDAGNFNSFNVSAQVVPFCQVSASNLNFGTVNGLFNNVTGISQISLQCVKGTQYQVSLNGGLNPQNGQRYMINGTGSVKYNLFQDANHTIPWGDTQGTNTVSGLGTGNLQGKVVYGLVPAQPTVKAGTYSDTVSVDVTY